MSNHICNSQSSSFTEAAYELGTSASEAFDTGNSSGLGQGLEIDNAGFFSTTRSGTSSQSSFRNLNENEVNAAAAASFASMSSQGSVSAVTNVYEPQDEYPNSAYVPPFSRSPMSNNTSFSAPSSRGSNQVNAYSMQQNPCNQSTNSNPFDISSASSTQFRPPSSVSILSNNSKKCSQQVQSPSMSSSHGYDLVASDAFRASLTSTNGYNNGLSYSKAPANSSILEEPECLGSQMWSQDCEHHHPPAGSSAPSTASSYGFNPYVSQPQPNYSNTILGSASIYNKPQSVSPVQPSGARVSFAAYTNNIYSSTSNSPYGNSSSSASNINNVYANNNNTSNINSVYSNSSSSASNINSVYSNNNINSVYGTNPSNNNGQQIPTAANNYIGTITGSISPYNVKPMTPVMSANSTTASNSNGYNSSVYGTIKPQTPIGTSIYAQKAPGNCAHSPQTSPFGFIAYGSTSGASSNPIPCQSAASGSIYNSKPSTPSQDPDCSASQMWSSSVASADCNGSQQAAPPSPFRSQSQSKCNGSNSVYNKPPSPQNDPDCSQTSSSSQMWGSDCASQQASAPCSNSASAAASNSNANPASNRGSVPAVSARASISSLRASFSVSQIASTNGSNQNGGARQSNVSFGVTSNNFGGSTSALYNNSKSQQDCRQSQQHNTLASASSANFNTYDLQNTFGGGPTARVSSNGGQSARVSFASFNETNSQQQPQNNYSQAQSASIYMKPQSSMGSTSVLYTNTSKTGNSILNSSRTSATGSARPSAVFGSSSNTASTSARLSSASFVAGSSKPLGSNSIIASGSLYLSGGLATSSSTNKQRSLFSSGSSSSLASNSGSMNQSGSGSAILSTSGSSRQSASNLFASAGSTILSASAPNASGSGSASARPSGSGSAAPASSRLSSASFAVSTSASNAPCSQAASGSNSTYASAYQAATYNSNSSTYNPETYRPSLTGSIISIGLRASNNNSNTSGSASNAMSGSAVNSASASGRCSANPSQQPSLNDNSNVSLRLSPTKSQSSYNNCKPQPPPQPASASASTQCKQSQTPPPAQPPCSGGQNQGFESKVEKAILASTEPIQINETQEISALGNRGIWANRCEVCTWKGDLPISEYPINEDACPEIINKKSQQRLQYNQEIAIRYLKPPAPPAPGDIIIKQEANTPVAPAPPIVIRQQPARPCTPEPLVIREAPPQPPPCIPQQVVTISGRRLPAPPRKVVIERMAPIPSKPQSVLIERWMPYAQAKRKVIFQAAPPDPVVLNPRNIIVQWEAPEVCVKKDIRHLGIICANPCDYAARYGSSMKKPCELPKFVLDIKPQCGVELAANKPSCQVPELEGDIDALKLIDLDKEGLGMYKKYVNQSNNNCNNNNNNSANNSGSNNSNDCDNTSNNRYSMADNMLPPPYSPVNNSSTSSSSASQTCSQNNSSPASSTISSTVNSRYSVSNAYSTSQNCY